MTRELRAAFALANTHEFGSLSREVDIVEEVFELHRGQIVRGGEERFQQHRFVAADEHLAVGGLRGVEIDHDRLGLLAAYGVGFARTRIARQG